MTPTMFAGVSRHVRTALLASLANRTPGDPLYRAPVIWRQGSIKRDIERAVAAKTACSADD